MYSLGSTKGDTLSVFKQKQYEGTKLRAEKYYKDYSYAKGIVVYKKALEKLPTDDTIKLQIAKGYFQVHNLDSAYTWYKSVITNESIVTEDIHFINYAEILTSKAEYQEAQYWFEKYEIKDRIFRWII